MTLLRGSIVNVGITDKHTTTGFRVFAQCGPHVVSRLCSTQDGLGAQIDLVIWQMSSVLERYQRSIRRLHVRSYLLYSIPTKARYVNGATRYVSFDPTMVGELKRSLMEK